MCGKQLNDISLYILDIALNSVEAGASVIKITVKEQCKSLTITISDNGKGMDANTLKRAADIGFTTKKTANSGAGLALLKSAAAEQNGSIKISSSYNRGTTVTAHFKQNTIAFGDLAETIVVLITSIKADFVYTHIFGGKKFAFNSIKDRNTIGINYYNNIEAALKIREYVNKSLLEIRQ